MASTTCPDRTDLTAFALGKLPNADFARVAGHVEQCRACDARLQELDELSDDVVDSLAHVSTDEFNQQTPPAIIDLAKAALRSAGASWSPADGKLGEFELLETLGSGSFGQVYRARDVELQRIVAVKILRAGRFATTADIERFKREARSAAQLKHPGIVLLYGSGQTEEGACYLVEEFIEGCTLAEFLKESRFGFREAAKLVADVAEALDYAHSNGVVHRDVKPSNIMLDGKEHPHLTDFGLAKWEADEHTATPDGQVMGTPEYMSPEQARGDVQQVDERSDIYSLGVVLYELLTGERPFRGNRRMLMLQVLEEDPRLPRRVNDRVPRDLETICLKAMAKSPARRYQTARELNEDLQRFLANEPIRARPIGPAERLWRWCRRNPVAAGLLVAVTLGSIVGMLHLSHLSKELMRRSALDSAGAHAEMLEEVNSQYSAKIVDRVGKHEIKATHDYFKHEKEIPLPATWLTELAESINERDSRMRVRHYSDYPFRFRKDGGPQDAFESEALTALREDPNEPFYRFEDDDKGRSVLRYAIAKRMKESCVDCHNKHPDSTKRDWKEGDVRGVLEIIRPLDQDVERTRQGLKGTYVLMISSFLLMLGASVFVLVAGNKRRGRH